MSRGELAPKPKPWWEKYGQEIWDMPFTLVDIEASFGRSHKEFEQGAMQTDISNVGEIIDMSADEVDALKGFLSPLKTKFGAEQDVSLLTLFDDLKLAARAARAGIGPWNGIQIFLKIVGENFLEVHREMQHELLVDKGYKKYCELDEDSNPLELESTLDIQDSSFIRDKIIEGILTSPDSGTQ